MSKKITDEQGNTYKMKKPFYKKIWFWVIVVIVVGGIGGALGGEDEEQGATKVENENTEQTSETEADEKKMMK